MRRIDLRRWTVSLLVLAGLLLVSGPALAQTTSPFNALPNATPDTLSTPTVSTSTDSNVISDGVQTWQAVLIVLAGMVLLLGIAFAIMRDARARAPIAEADETTVAQHTRDAHATKQEAKRKQRQKAKTVRAQRRRNR